MIIKKHLLMVGTSIYTDCGTFSDHAYVNSKLFVFPLWIICNLLTKLHIIHSRQHSVGAVNTYNVFYVPQRSLICPVSFSVFFVLYQNDLFHVGEPSYIFMEAIIL